MHFKKRYLDSVLFLCFINHFFKTFIVFTGMFKEEFIQAFLFICCFLLPFRTRGGRTMDRHVILKVLCWKVVFQRLLEWHAPCVNHGHLFDEKKRMFTLCSSGRGAPI